jgi:polysaccharide biosynthesis protein PslE
MEEQSSFKGMHQTITSLSRDAVAVTFRRRKLIRKAFVWSLLGGILAVMLFGILYESDSEIAVRPWTRTPATITEDNSPRPTLPGDNNGVEEAINSEIELLTTDDILQHVVVTCKLQYGIPKWYTPAKLWVYRTVPGYWDQLIPKAVAKLNDDLEIDEVKSSNMLTIAYTSKDPTMAACVTRALTGFYVAKHNAAWRPQKMFDFFAEQSEDYKKRLYDDERAMFNWQKANDAVDSQTQMVMSVNQMGQFLSSERTTEAGEAANHGQLKSGDDQRAVLAPRMDTTQTISDNYQLMAQLKASLVNLELQRTSLLVKYDPSYPLVKAIDVQIQQAQQAIAEQQNQPVKDASTGPNPVVLYLDQVNAGNRIQLAGQAEQLKVMKNIVKQYHDEATAFDYKAMLQNDMQREVSAMQNNYLLYLTKREEGRIEDMLDKRQIDNVTIVKTPTIPVIPTFNPLVLVALAVVLAVIIAICLAFVVDYLDPSFRTPDEVQEFLDVPVFASIPESGQEAVVGAVHKNGN